MAIEKERKFLVNPSKLPEEVLKNIGNRTIQTGYFTSNGVAVRVSYGFGEQGGERFKVCFKSPGGYAREEYEYSVPKEDALGLLKLSPTLMTKNRLEYQGWEIDRVRIPYRHTEFFQLQEIWLAEWEEMEGKESMPKPLPDWIVGDVTGNHQYSMQGIAWKFFQVPVKRGA